MPRAFRLCDDVRRLHAVGRRRSLVAAPSPTRAPATGRGARAPHGADGRPISAFGVRRWSAPLVPIPQSARWHVCVSPCLRVVVPGVSVQERPLAAGQLCASAAVGGVAEDAAAALALVRLVRFRIVDAGARSGVEVGSTRPHASRRRDLPEPEGDAEAAEGPGSLRDRSSTACSIQRKPSLELESPCRRIRSPIRWLLREQCPACSRDAIARSSTPISGGAMSSTATFMHVSKMTRHLFLRTHVRRLTTVPSSIMVGAPAGSKPGWKRGRRTMAAQRQDPVRSIEKSRASLPAAAARCWSQSQARPPGRSDEQGAVALHALTQSMGLQELPLSDQSIIHPSIIASLNYAADRRSCRRARACLSPDPVSRLRA